MPRKELSPPDENRNKAERLTDGTMQQAGAYTAAGRSLPERLTDGKSVKNTKSQVKGAIERGSGFAKASSDEMFSDEEVTRKPSKSNKSAREYAMALVAARAYTERGLREKMRIRGYGCDETDDAVEYLKGFGYINDLRLAQNAAEKLADKLNGKRKIFAYLASKGISRDTVAEIDLSEIDFKENCRTLALKLQAAGKPYEKIVASLTRAGFSSSEIYYAMKVIQ